MLSYCTSSRRNGTFGSNELIMCRSTGSFFLVQPVFFVWLMVLLIILIVRTLNIDV